MPERTEDYTTSEERMLIINAAESQGETMIHDDHHVKGRGIHMLTFDILPEVIPETPSQVEVIERRLLANPKLTTANDIIMLEIARLKERYKV